MRLSFDARLRLWFVSVAAIVLIVAVGRMVAHSSPTHVATPIVVRLAAAAIVTVFAVVAYFLRGPRAAAATAVLGTFVVVALLVGLA